MRPEPAAEGRTRRNRAGEWLQTDRMRRNPALFDNAAERADRPKSILRQRRPGVDHRARGSFGAVRRGRDLRLSEEPHFALWGFERVLPSRICIRAASSKVSRWRRLKPSGLKSRKMRSPPSPNPRNFERDSYATLLGS